MKQVVGRLMMKQVVGRLMTKQVVGQLMTKQVVGQLMIYWREEERHWRILSKRTVGCCCWPALAGWSEP
jgi:hypothetical protein